jgi:gamma-glutamyl:cysteine ligase YbdK (ATP-grasp superfamily)
VLMAGYFIKKCMAASTNVVLDCSFKTKKELYPMKTYGIERERFIVNRLGQIIPAIGTLLPKVWELAKNSGIPEPEKLFSHELFAGQIEDRTPPHRNLRELKKSLELNDRIMLEAASQLDLGFDYSEFVEAERITSLEVNPFDQRHKQIWQSIPPQRRIAASIVAAMHIHVSVTSDEAVKLLNFCRKDVIDKLIDIGDHSNRKRINAYRIMAETEGVPPTFFSSAEVMDYINGKGGEKNVWDLVRYKPSTETIEFRMFGTTQSVEEVLGYVKACIDVSASS